MARPTPARRTAHFVSALCVAWPDGHTEEFEAIVEGTLVWPPRGEAGFGYDPMFLPDGHERTFGEMTSDEETRPAAAWTRPVASRSRLHQTCGGLSCPLTARPSTRRHPRKFRTHSVSMCIGLSAYRNAPIAISTATFVMAVSMRSLVRQAYLREIEATAARVPDQTVSTIFFGGGTPSLMNPSTVCGDPRAASPGIGPLPPMEVTLEANPD